MQQQTPEWLNLFIDAHGTKGLIALAWWIGARHAVEIRELEGSFPFLQVVAHGPDASTLLDTLSTLSGSPETPMINPGACTPSALTRTMFADTTLPLVINEVDCPSATPFDWDALKPMFNNCTIGALGQRNGHSHAGKVFARGMAILAKETDNEIGNPALHARTVVLNVDQVEQPRSSERAFQLLRQLGSNADALSLNPSAWRQLVYRIGGTQGHIDALQKELGNRLTRRHANNYAQMIALVCALDDIFNLPEGQRTKAIYAIRDMAAATAEVPF